MHFGNAGLREMQVDIPATLENIDEVDTRLCAFLVEAGVPIDLFAVRIIFHEAMMNAVIHGSSLDAGMSVHVEAKLTESGLALIVRDQGNGFPWRETHGDIDQALDSGRGVPLMRIYASSVEYNEAGNQVTLFREYNPKTQSQLVSAGGSA